MIMKNLFNLLLTALCCISCICAITAESTEAFVIASSMMCFTAIVFIINAKYNMFFERDDKKKKLVLKQGPSLLVT